MNNYVNQFAEVQREIETTPYFSNDVPTADDMRLMDCDIDDAVNEIIIEERNQAIKKFNRTKEELDHAIEEFNLASEEFDRVYNNPDFNYVEHNRVRDEFYYAYEVFNRASEEFDRADETYESIFYNDDSDSDSDSDIYSDSDSDIGEDDDDEDDYVNFMERTEGINIKYDYFCCDCEEFDSYDCSCGKYFRIRLMNDIRFSVSKINECKVAREAIRNSMRNTVHEDLIAAAMHPCRIQAQMVQFDDIESYFTAIGY